MKAVVLREHCESGLRYETDFPDPVPGAGDVVVRVRAIVPMSDLPLSTGEIQERLGQSAFIELLNLTVLSADPVKQQLVMRAAMRPEFERGRGSGQWHGGPIAAIIDMAGDYALVMLLGRPLPTVNFRVDYLRPAIDTALVVTATVRRSGRLVGVVDVAVANEAGQLLAIGRATYATAA
jgi:uncharacterized protein (TIGR00369 family)